MAEVGFEKITTVLQNCTDRVKDQTLERQYVNQGPPFSGGTGNVGVYFCGDDGIRSEIQSMGDVSNRWLRGEIEHKQCLKPLWPRGEAFLAIASTLNSTTTLVVFFTYSVKRELGVKAQLPTLSFAEFSTCVKL